jgi:hypothetical protein
MRASASVGTNDLSGLLSGLGTHQMNAPRATNTLTLLGSDSRFGGPRVSDGRSYKHSAAGLLDWPTTPKWRD